MKLWNDSTGLWDLLNLWICENLGALSPSNPCAFEALKSFIPLTRDFWIMETSTFFRALDNMGKLTIP